jgi:hypothetical protein
MTQNRGTTEARQRPVQDQASLRRAAREAIRAGRIPGRAARRSWGGPGSGRDCVVCETPVTADELAMELEFDAENGGDPRVAHLHIRCSTAWEAELIGSTAEPGPEVNGTNGLQAASVAANLNGCTTTAGEGLPETATLGTMSGRERDTPSGRGAGDP